jgi:hypothetical protein
MRSVVGMAVRFTSMAVAALAVVFLSGCGSRTPDDVEDLQRTDNVPYVIPEELVEARERYHFRSLGEMARAAELVIVGSVAAVGTGPTLGGGEEGPAFTLRELTVSVETVLKGPADLTSLTVVEEGTFEEGKDYSINQSRWANAGARALFFLVKLVDVPGQPYGLVNSQSRFFLHDEKVVPNTHPDRLEPFEQRLAGLGVDELLSQARNAL